jgi:putative flippase GtrA
MLHLIHPHLTLFALYVVSGSTAAVMDFGSYFLLIHMGIWYIAASTIGSILGFWTAFLCHKYFVFKKRQAFFKHLGRYCMVEVLSTGLSLAILYGFVEYTSVGEEYGKIISMGSVVLWNFFLYKLFVYV